MGFGTRDLEFYRYWVLDPFELKILVSEVIVTGFADVSLPFFLDAEMERQSAHWLHLGSKRIDGLHLSLSGRRQNAGCDDFGSCG